MTAEDAAELLEIFRTGAQEAPAMDPAILAHAYLRILGSLPGDRELARTPAQVQRRYFADELR